MPFYLTEVLVLALHVFVWMLCCDVFVMQGYKLSATECPFAKESGNDLWDTA